LISCGSGCDQGALLPVIDGQAVVIIEAASCQDATTRTETESRNTVRMETGQSGNVSPVIIVPHSYKRSAPRFTSSTQLAVRVEG
jgi:hypothetical protein